jgi:hypothetical protein
MKKFLNDDELKSAKKKRKKIALIILLIGLSIGFIFVGLGIKNHGLLKNQNSAEYKAEISQQLSNESATLLAKAAQLKAKGVKYNRFAQYYSGDEYDLKIITEVLDPSFDYWKFNEYKNHSLTSKYCELKQTLDEIENSNAIMFESYKYLPFYIVGAFIIISTIIAVSITLSNKQTSLDLVSSNIESITQDMNNKQKEQDTKKLKKCKYCGSLLKIDETECESCGGKEFTKHKH